MPAFTSKFANACAFGLLFLAASNSVIAVDAPATFSRTIVLVRHGNYVSDPSADPKLGPGLSPLGVAQAHLVGARLASMPTHFDALFASPLQRARDTAAIIAEDFPGRSFAVLDDLEECTPPTRRSEIIKDEKPEVLAACKAQLDRLFDAHFKPADSADRTEMYVCHGNVIRYLTTRALGVDTTAWLDMSVHHASITQIRVEADGRFKIISVGDSGYMPANLLTGATGDSDRSLAIPKLPVPTSE